MSEERVIELFAALSKDEVLRKQISDAGDLQARLEVASANGYEFTAEELDSVLSEIRSAREPQELSEDDLEKVAGGILEHEVIEYQDGDDLFLRKRPGRTKYGNITLKKGYVATTILSDWIE